MKFDSNIYDSIIISSCLFGSVYLFSNSLKLISESDLENKNSVMINAISGLTTVISGSVFIYGVLRFKHLTK
jgi:hypothetical protein